MLTNDDLIKLREFARPFLRVSESTLYARELVGETWRTEPGDPRGQLEAGDGYWIVRDDVDEWPVKSDVFKLTYVYDDKRQDTTKEQGVQKFVWTSLVKMRRPFDVMTEESVEEPQHGAVGDYLAFGALNEMWVIRSEVVDRRGMYEEISGPEDERPRVFISYSREDFKGNGIVAIQELGAHLAGNNWVSREKCEVFLDKSKIRGGDNWRRKILREIALSDVVILIVGQNWLNKACDRGEGVAFRYELPLAVLNQRSRGVIIPVLLDVPASDLSGSLPVLNGHFPLDGPSSHGPLLIDDGRKVSRKRVVEQAIDVGKLLIEEAVRAMKARRAIGLPDFDAIFGPEAAVPTETKPGGPAVSVVADDTASLAVSREPVEPTFHGPIVEGPWVALNAEDGPLIVMVDGSTLVGFLDVNGSPIDIELDSEIDAVVAADDGTALVASAGGRLHVVEVGSRPRRWAAAIELPTPTSRPLAMMRNGRTYEVDLADDLRRYTRTIDSGGSGRGRASSALGSATAAAVVSGQIVNVCDGRAPKAPNLIRGLNRAGLRTWLSIDSKTVAVDRARVNVVAGLGRTKSGDTILAVQRGGDVRAMIVDPAASAIAVTRCGTAGDTHVILQVDDELLGWRVDALPALA